MSSVNSTSSSAIRLTGLATGLDTDTTVKQMMSAYQTRLDKMKQDKEIVSWKQEMYRDILTDVNTFKSTYFDVLKPDSYMLSKNSYSGYKIEAASSISGQTAGVSVTAGTGAQVGEYTVKVTQLAEGAKFEGTTAMDSSVNLDTKLSAGTLNINVNDSFTLTYKDSSNVEQVKTIVISDNNITVNALINKVSQETSGNVKMKFSELTGKFSIETLKTGTNTTLSVAETNGMLGKLKITTANNITGQDAIADIKDPTGNSKQVVKSSNIFTIDNVTYNLKRTPVTNEVNTITVQADVQKPLDKIKTFIDKYNELIDKINTKISEKKQYTYLPLTDEQKEAMSEDQITAWEKKAKQGLLKGDGMFQNMLTSLRAAFYEGVEGAGLTLTDIGLSTSADTSKGGKIIIDDIKLKEALETRGDQVAAIFSKTSTSHPSFSTDLTTSQRNTRSKEEGIFQKIQDIFQDYTRTLRDSNGKKGLLLEKAGLKGDVSEYKNLLTKDMDDRQTRINDFLEKMKDKETRYYNQFAKLETAMNQLNSQSSWLAQQLGTNS